MAFFPLFWAIVSPAVRMVTLTPKRVKEFSALGASVRSFGRQLAARHSDVASDGLRCGAWAKHVI
ncbi:MAG: hypothetical protein WA002_07205, partial [Candidatus Acidiferrales bacterium]